MVAYLEKSEGSEEFHQIIDFLSTSHIKKVKVLVIEASIRRHLKLEDFNGLNSLPTTKIFEQLAHIGVKKLEQTIKTSQARRRTKIVISDDEDAEEDSSKQGRKISKIDKDPTNSLVQEEEWYGLGGCRDINGEKNSKSLEPLKKIKKRVQVQISIDEELAKKVFEEEQARFNVEQEAKFKAEQEKKGIDFETNLKLQKASWMKEKEVVSAHDIVGECRSYPAVVLRYHAIQNRSFSKLVVPNFDWKTYVLAENFIYYQIFRADGISKNYKIFTEMLNDFDRQDVLYLHRLVKERYKTSSPEGYDLML
ncbi:hypothetical protein Tco_0014790 [Tanacetum coccineum]